LNNIFCLEYMILTTRNQLIENIRRSILKTRSWKELQQVLVQLEVAPFCALETCYDLQHVVYHILNAAQRSELLRHISAFPPEHNRIHFMIPLSFLQTMSVKERNRFAAADESEFITVFSTDTEENEYLNRNRTAPIRNSMISELSAPAFQEQGANNLRDVLSNQIAARVAKQYCSTIINYLKLFPHYNAVWIDTLNAVAIHVAANMHEHKQKNRSLRWNGAILLGHPRRTLKSDLKAMRIQYFTTHEQLLEIIRKQLNETD
jgi:hypothetical protein